MNEEQKKRDKRVADSIKNDPELDRKIELMIEAGVDMPTIFLTLLNEAIERDNELQKRE